MNNRTYFFIALLLICSFAKGQTPLTYQQQYESLLHKTPVYNLSYVDNETETKNAAELYAEQRLGKILETDIDIKRDGIKHILDNGDNLWLLKIASSSAYALMFYFDAFKLPPGATLYFYNEDKSMLLGAYTHLDNRISERFAIPMIAGSRIYIEYFEPYHTNFSGELHINRVVHIFKNIFSNAEKGPLGNSADCNINIECDLGGDTWKEEAKSVGLIAYYKRISNGVELTSLATGALINKATSYNDSDKAIFYTAAHVDAFLDVEEWIILFNHEAGSCSDTEGVNAPINQAVAGNRVLCVDDIDDRTSDYLLVELDATVNELKDYGISYAGWDKRIYQDDLSSSITMIHHPQGDVKKISVDEHSPVSENFLLSDTRNLYWQMQFEHGLGEPGSSGAPIFNSDKRIIGQYRGGCSTICGEDPSWTLYGEVCPDGIGFGYPDYAGKFSSAWDLKAVVPVDTSVLFRNCGLHGSYYFSL